MNDLNPKYTIKEKKIFILDDHRFSFSVWASAKIPKNLVTIDAHYDLADITNPDRINKLQQLNLSDDIATYEFARDVLRADNSDQICAAIKKGIIKDVYIHSPHISISEQIHSMADFSSNMHRFYYYENGDKIKLSEECFLDFDLDFFARYYQDKNFDLEICLKSLGVLDLIPNTNMITICRTPKMTGENQGDIIQNNLVSVLKSSLSQ